MNKEYDVAVVIGRMQPPHIGHLKIIREALSQADKLILVLGSHRAAPDIKNPWTSLERKQMVLSSLSYQEQKRTEICFVRDQYYHETNWIASVQQKISELTEEADRIALFGCDKDNSTYYLHHFPQWSFVDVGLHYSGLSSTQIRESYFENVRGWTDKSWGSSVPEPVKDFLLKFKETEQFKKLEKYYQYIKQYKKQWAAAPYPPTFVTVDAVVVKSGHILLIRRGFNPGKGQIALPGGFIDQNETIEESMLRELKEETRISISKKVLKESIVKNHVFDYPTRSLRGRTITHAYFVRLPDSGTLPRVKGGDDAKGAFWCPLGDLSLLEDEFFEDHLQIINYFTNL